MQNRKLGRTSDHRKALLRNMATDMIVHEKINTTEMKAKELRSVVDELVTLAKRVIYMHVVERQRLSEMLSLIRPQAEQLTEIVEEIGPRFADTNGGYTRVVKPLSEEAMLHHAYIEFTK